MFPRNSFLYRALVALVVVGVMVGVASSIYRTGFTQGYVQAASGGAEVSPGFRDGLRHSPWGWGPRFGFFPFFPLGGCLFGLLLLFLFGGLLRGAFGRRHGCPPGQWQERRQPEGVPPLDTEPPVEDVRSSDRL